jgi:dienelactone hydrolase
VEAIMKKAFFVVLVVMLVSLPAHGKVVSRSVEYKQDNTVLQGYLAYDDSKAGKRPGVLVVHEWWGLNDYVRSRVNKLAQLGYVAFALDMYGKNIWTTDPNKAKELSGHLRGTPLLRERANAGLDILRKNQLVDPKRIAAIGYCFGGTTVLELAYGGADVAGVASFHGGLTSPKPEDMGNIKAKILVLHGADDTFTSNEAIAAFQDAMRKANTDWQMVYFGGAVHSFTNPGADKVGIKGIAYNPKADARSWSYMVVFLKELFK